MTHEELQRFIKQQLSMGARIAQKANRARVGAAAFTNVKSGSGKSLGDRILAAVDRPGVAPSSRPLSAAGAQTFHFAVTTVSRTSNFAQKMKNDVAGKAGDHMSYVEREGAAEAIDAAVKRDADAIDHETWKILGGQEYIERPDAAEVLPDGRTLASFGNIAATLTERVAYWDAMEQAAPTPKSHGVVTDRTADPAFWDRVDSDPAAPSRLRSTPKWIPLPVADSVADADRLNRPIPVPRVSDKEAIEIAQYAAKHRSKGKTAKKAVEIDPGRGGKIQNRIIVELPHELSAAQRLDLAKAFCERHFVEGREAPLPHWCVIHAPDHHNDPRNTHMHIVFAERPTKRMRHPETGEEVWDFEVIEHKRDKHRNKWTTRPFEQAPDRSLKDVRWVKKVRSDYADMANEALAAAGKSKIYDARTYKEMGIEVDARKRINPKDYVKEKQGISTVAGAPAVAEQWRREEERLAKRHPSLDPSPKVLKEFDDEFARWSRSTTSTKYRVKSLRHEWMIAQAHRRYHAAEAAANALVMRKIKSKLIPPLGSDSQATADAVAYLRMFKTDLIDRHTAAAQRWAKGERYILTCLKQAQKADPKTATVDSFMDGSNVLRAMKGMVNAAHADAIVLPPRTMQQIGDALIASTQATVEENREIEAAQRAVVEARRGSVEQYPTSMWERAADWLVRNTPHPAKLELPPTETLPVWEGGETGRWSMPDGVKPTNTPPPPAKRVGDEVVGTFLSDTGAPVQRRVFSPSTVAQRERMADAIIANVAKRRAEREAARLAAIEAEQKAQGERARKEQRRMDAEDAAAAAARARDAGPRSAAAGQTERRDAPRPAQRPAPGTGERDIGAAASQAMPGRPATVDAGAARPPAEPASVRPGDSAPPPPTTTAQKIDTPTPPPVQPTSATSEGSPLLPGQTTGYQPAGRPAIIEDPTRPNSVAPAATTDATEKPGADVSDMPPKKKKRVLTAEQLRQRALLAAKNRGRGR